MKYKDQKFLIFLFFISFGIRALFFQIYLKHNPVMLQFDSLIYHTVAVSIAENNQISNENGRTNFLRVPLYSIFIGTCYKIFGIKPKVALFIQLAISSLIPILIYFLSLALFPANIFLAKLSAITSCFNLGFIIFSSIMMAESLFSLFFILFLISFFLFLKRPIIFLKIFLAGIFLGIASLVRPVGHYLFFLSVVFLLFVSVGFKEKFKAIFIFSFSWLITVFPWLLRNYLLTGYIFFHTLPGIHFVKHGAARIVMNVENISYLKALNIVNSDFSKAIEDEENKLGRSLFEIEWCKLGENVSLKYFLNYPTHTIKHIIVNGLKTIFGLYSSELLFIDSAGVLPDYSNSRTASQIFLRFLSPKFSTWWLIFIVYFELIYFLFLLIGFYCFWISFFLKKSINLNLTYIILVYAILIFLSSACGFARLRLPLEPFLIVLSLYFWTKIFKKRRVEHEQV